MQSLAIIKNQDVINKLTSTASYSYRRAYVDNFFFSCSNYYVPGMRVADLGGKKKNKRGVFSIENYQLKTEYFNIDESSLPDYLCDLQELPTKNAIFDMVILSEVLEHVESPIKVLTEASRILKDGGVILITTPFLFRVHKDPTDYQRFTDMWFTDNMKRLGFEIITMENHGYLYSVLSNLLKSYIHDIQVHSKRERVKTILRFLQGLLFNILYRISKLDKGTDHTTYVKTNTTGYGILAKKIK